MDKGFILFDKINNIQKNAKVIVKFSLDGKDYLVYSIDENEQNCQIFVSRLTLNLEGKCFIDNILPEEKGKLNNVVYNIVILVPSDAQKGNSFDILSKGLSDKFSVNLSLDIPSMDIQEYYSNCSVAITSKILVDSAIKLYGDNLTINTKENVAQVPTWTAPVEVTSPTPLDTENVDVPTASVVEPVINVPVQDSVSITNVVNQEPSAVQAVSASVVPQSPVSTIPTQNPVVTTSSVEPLVEPNPQAEKLAVVSDPSLGIGVQQPNVLNNKKAGFANTKYIVAGSVCLALAVATVVTAYILISNM